MADCCILFTTTLQKQNAAPRFSLVSFCLSCSIPAVLLLSSKTASALSKRQKRYRFYHCPETSLPYICTHPPYRRNWLWGGGPCICCLFYRSCYAILIIPITIMNNIYILNIHIIIFIELFFAY